MTFWRLAKSIFSIIMLFFNTSAFAVTIWNEAINGDIDNLHVGNLEAGVYELYGSNRSGFDINSNRAFYDFDEFAFDLRYRQSIDNINFSISNITTAGVTEIFEIYGVLADYNYSENTWIKDAYNDILISDMPALLSKEGIVWDSTFGFVPGANFDCVGECSLEFDYILTFEISSVPVPAAVWLFGSGLISLVGFARRKRVA